MTPPDSGGRDWAGAEPDAVTAFRAKVHAAFAPLKAVTRYDEAVSSSIRLPEGRGYLVCVGELHADDDATIEKLARWRDEARTFHNQFKVTFDGTRRWLRERLLDEPDRILYLVLEPRGRAIGHMGLSIVVQNDCLLEIDNVIRGVHGTEPGIMSLALKAMMSWADGAIEPSGYWLRTYDDNVHAIDFYARLGFTIYERQPLRRVEQEGQARFVPRPEGDAAPPDLVYVHMRVAPGHVS